MRLASLCFFVALSLAVLTFACIGCTSAQVDQSIDAANHLIAATQQPVVDDLGSLPVIGPYVRLASQVIGDVLYEAVRALDAMKPRAGEPSSRNTNRAVEPDSPRDEQFASGRNSVLLARCEWEKCQ